jgi:hypothetical protein
LARSLVHPGRLIGRRIQFPQISHSKKSSRVTSQVTLV